MQKKGFIVTPWDVEGDIDYDKLMEDFGAQKISHELLNEIKTPHHLYLKRGYFFSHRDLDVALKEHASGSNFALATGRGPSEQMHIGHMLPIAFTAWLQKKYDANVYFQLTDDEKYYFKEGLSFEDAQNYAVKNALDVIAFGYNPDKTFIFRNLEYTKIYKMSAQIAKKITLSTARAVFGEEITRNLGTAFFPSVQTAHLLMANFIEGPKRVIVPMAIDQDPYEKIARDVAPKMGFVKPGAIHSRFLPGLQGSSSKMSASRPETSVYLTDDPETVRYKILNALTGGGSTLKEHKEKGGKPDACVIYQYLYTLFEKNDKRIIERMSACKAGNITCGGCKECLISKINKFLEEHRKKKKKAEKKLEKFMHTGKLAQKAWNWG